MDTLSPHYVAFSLCAHYVAFSLYSHYLAFPLDSLFRISTHLIYNLFMIQKRAATFAKSHQNKQSRQTCDCSLVHRLCIESMRSMDFASWLFDDFHLQIFYFNQRFPLTLRTIERIVLQNSIFSDSVTGFISTNGTKYPFTLHNPPLLLKHYLLNRNTLYLFGIKIHDCFIKHCESCEGQKHNRNIKLVYWNTFHISKEILIKSVFP